MREFVKKCDFFGWIKFSLIKQHLHRGQTCYRVIIINRSDINSVQAVLSFCGLAVWFTDKKKV